jgi:hypothetical protein
MMKDFMEDFLRIPDVIKKIDVQTEVDSTFGKMPGEKGQPGFHF